MEIKNYKEQQAVSNPHGIQSFLLHSSKDAVAMHLILKPGEALRPHITPVNVLFYVLEGAPEIMVGEERIKVKQDDLIESPAEIVHCIYNTSSQQDARVLVLKVPKPVTATKFIK